MVFVDASGVPVVVEVKLARNPQSRREVIAQVFDYASALTDWTVDELDDATGGALETALRKLLEEDEVAFKEPRSVAEADAPRKYPSPPG